MNIIPALVLRTSGTKKLAGARSYKGVPGPYNLIENLDYLFTDKKANNTLLLSFRIDLD